MLLAFQVSELQYPVHTADYKHGCQGSISKNGHTWQISKSSDFWLYVGSDTLYRKTRFPHFLRSTCFFRVTTLQTPTFLCVCVCGCTISISDAKPDSFLGIDSFLQFSSMNRFIGIHLFSNNAGSFYINETFK